MLFFKYGGVVSLLNVSLRWFGQQIVGRKPPAFGIRYRKGPAGFGLFQVFQQNKIPGLSRKLDSDPALCSKALGKSPKLFNFIRRKIFLLLFSDFTFDGQPADGICCQNIRGRIAGTARTGDPDGAPAGFIEETDQFPFSFGAFGLLVYHCISISKTIVAISLHLDLHKIFGDDAVIKILPGFGDDIRGTFIALAEMGNY